MNINLALKTVYFDAINRGIKKTEYRDGTSYYVDLFVDKTHYEGLTNEQIIEVLRAGGKFYPRTDIDTITFYNNPRKMVVEVRGIDFLDHHTTFAIKLGKKKR